MKGKRWRKKKGSLLAISKQPQIQISKQKEIQTRKKNKKIGRRWEKDGMNRGRPGLMRGNKPLLLATHTYGKPRDWRPRAFHLFTHSEYTHTHTSTRWCIHAVQWKAPRVYEIRGSSPLRRWIMGEGYVSLQRSVLIRACDHGCARMCVVRVHDYTCTGVMIGTRRWFVCWCAFNN